MEKKLSERRKMLHHTLKIDKVDRLRRRYYLDYRLNKGKKMIEN